MNFLQAIEAGFMNYANFTGRASRSEFWFFSLFIFLGNIVVVILAGILDVDVLKSVWDLAILVPSISVAVRRLHDTDKSGWWILLPFTIIGIIPYLIWLVQKGNDNENRFGADPLG